MLPSHGPAEIGILVYPGVQLATVHGLTDVFGLADQYARARGMDGTPGLRITHWHVDPHSAQVTCEFDTVPGSSPRPQFVIIPLTLLDWPAPATTASATDWLKERYADGAALGSICSGALILAETGLLNGRLASTHWSYADKLRERFPEVRIDSQIRIVDYGDLVTVGGFMAWVDMGLRLIARFLGPSIAEQTSQFLLLRPEAAQAPYFQGFAPNLVHDDAAVLRAQQLIHACDGRDVSLVALAQVARLEKRTLIRRFERVTKMSPIEYSRNVRIARARELLEHSSKTLKELAWEVGYDDTRGFTRAFRRLVGMSPMDYRRRHLGSAEHAAA